MQQDFMFTSESSRKAIPISFVTRSVMPLSTVFCNRTRMRGSLRMRRFTAILFVARPV